MTPLGEDEDLRSIVEQLEAMEAKALEMWKDRFQIQAEPEVLREKRFWMRKGLKPICSAQLDVGYFDPFSRQALIIDDKSGFLNPTSAAFNFQLLVQACCMQEDYDLAGATVAIAHARLRSRYTEAYYSREQIDAGRSLINTAIINGDNPAAPRYPGDWCLYCRAKPHCREAHAWLMMDLLDAPQLDAKEKVKEFQVRMDEHTGGLDLDHAVSIWKKISVGNKLWDSIIKRLKSLTIEELHELGLDLKDTGETRKITDRDEAIKLMINYMSRVEFDACSVPNLGMLEAMYKSNHGGTAKAAKAAVDELLNNVIERTPKAKSLKLLK